MVRILALVAAALVGAGGLTLVNQRSTIGELRSDLRAERREVAELNEDSRDLRDRISDLQDILGEQRELTDIAGGLAAELEHCADGMQIVALTAVENTLQLPFVEDVVEYCESAQERNRELQRYVSRVGSSF